MTVKTYKLLTNEDTQEDNSPIEESESLVKQLQHVQVEEQDESSTETAS